MNANKKTSGWILCPSKTFPGKFYYFNVSTGEAAWGLVDAEKKIKNDVLKISDNHCHPEPSGPPTDSIVKSDSIVSRPFESISHSTPVFGQPAFPKVPPKSKETNVIWTPIHIQVPIVLADKNQAKEIEKIEIDKELFVQMCEKPLGQRFVNYERPMIKFDKDNKIENKLHFNNFFTSTPNKNQKVEPKKFISIFENNSKRSDSSSSNIFQSNSSLSFSDLSPKITNQKRLIKEPVFNFKVPSKVIEKVFQEPEDKVKHSKQLFPTFEITADNNVLPKSCPSFSDVTPEIPNWRISDESEPKPEKVPEKRLELQKLERNVFQSKNGLSFSDFGSKIEKQTPLTNADSKTKNVHSERKISNLFQRKSNSNGSDINSITKQTWVANESESTKTFKTEQAKIDSKAYGNKNNSAAAGSNEKLPNDKDLRMLLVAKRRKSLTHIKADEPTNTNRRMQVPKKKVTFNPEVLVENISFDGDDEEEDSGLKAKQATTMQYLKDMTSSNIRQDLWCITVDSKTLLNEFTDIQSLVQIDPKCKLLIPSRVVSEISSISIGHGDRATIMVARNIIRRLTSPYIILQSSNDKVDALTHDCIVQCCIEAMDQNLHVILIATDEELLSKARLNSIICFSIQEIKNGITEKPLQFEPPNSVVQKQPFKEMKITISNTDAKFAPNSPVNSFKKKLFSKTDDDLNEKEKEIIRNLIENSHVSRKCTIDSEKPHETHFDVDEYASISNLFSTNSNEKSTVSNGYANDSQKSKISNRFAMTNGKFTISNELAVDDENSKTSNRFSMSPTEKRTISNEFPAEISEISHVPKLSNEKFAISNEYAIDINPELSNSFSMTENSNFSCRHHARNTKESKENSMNSRKKQIFNDDDENINGVSRLSKDSNDWRYATSDISENTIDEDMRNLNIKDKPVSRLKMYKTPEEKQTQKNTEELNETISYYFQQSTPKFDIRKDETSKSYIQNSETQKNNFRKQSPEVESQTVSFFFRNENKKHNELKVQKHSEKLIPKPNFEIGNTSKFFVKHNLSDKTKEFQIRNLEKINIPASSPFKSTEKFEKQPDINKQNTKEVTSSANSSFRSFEKQNSQKTKELEISENRTAKVSFQSHSFEKQPVAKDNPKFEIRISENEVCTIPHSNDQQKKLAINGIQSRVDLSRFHVKSKVMENRLIERMDEWVCSFKQIMEEFLSSILEVLPPSVQKPILPPWTLYEALQCTKNVYKDHATLKNIVDEMCGYLYETTFKRDKLKQNLTPNDFMKAFGCGIHLMKYLKNILQHSDELHAECHLLTIMEEIENPMTDINEPLVQTPTVVENKEFPRQNFVKNRSDIINYLKNHYPDWKKFHDERKSWDDLKIVRTIGKDLKLLHLKKVGHDLKSNGDKNNEDQQYKAKGSNKNEKQLEMDKHFLENIKMKHTNGDPIAKTKEAKNLSKDFERNSNDKENQNGRNILKNIFENVTSTPKTNFEVDTKTLGVKITIPNDYKTQNNEYAQIDEPNENLEINSNFDGTDKDKVSNEPKLIRNVNLIEKYEKRIHKPLDLYELDYNPILSQTNYGKNETIACMIHTEEMKSDVTYCDSKTEHQQAKTGPFPKHCEPDRHHDRDDDDSGLGNESPQAYFVVTSFCADLQCSLHMIHRFIDGSIQEFRDGKIRDETKKTFRLKAFEANFVITKIIVRLKKLANKEKNRITGQTGTESGDKLVSKYAEAVTQCLEKALILHKTLNLMLSVTDGDDSLSIKTEHSSLSINLSS